MNGWTTFPLTCFSLLVAGALIGEANAQCTRQLVGNSFDCQFKSDSEFDPSGQTCLEFNNELSEAPKFDLFQYGGASLEGFVISGCSCDPDGDFAEPGFNESEEFFTCAGQEFVDDFDFPWATSGFVDEVEEFIVALQVDILSASYVLVCEKVSSCQNARSARSADGSTVDEGPAATQRVIEQELYKQLRDSE